MLMFSLDEKVNHSHIIVNLLIILESDNDAIKKFKKNMSY